MRRTLQSGESGQVVALLPVLLTVVLLGVAALAIDVGAWLTASRHVQGVADAAALAAVQDLPSSVAAAQADATAYAASNDGTLDGQPVVSSSSPTTPNDTVSVKAKETVPAFFARLLGLGDVTVHATASAQVAAASIIQQDDVQSDGTGRPLPFAISKDEAPSPGCNCFDKPESFCIGPHCPVGPGQFGTVDFANAKGGTPPSTVAGWVTNGYPGDLAPGLYFGVPGNKANPPEVSDAMAAVAAKHLTVLLPVYDPATSGGDGANFQYNVIGWAALKVDSWVNDHSEQYINGSFQVLQTNTHGKSSQYFGVGHVKLTK